MALPVYCCATKDGAVSRERWTKAFLWFSAMGWGVGLGAKLFDLIVVAGAWGASPPASLTLMPYGPKYPVDPGLFFQPLSAVMAVGLLGALLAGWNTPSHFKRWLWLPFLVFLLIWAITPTVFWPMIRELYGAGTGRVVRSEAELVATVHRWMVWDSFRTVLIAIGYVGMRALSLPYPKPEQREAAVAN